MAIARMPKVMRDMGDKLNQQTNCLFSSSPTVFSSVTSCKWMKLGSEMTPSFRGKSGSRASFLISLNEKASEELSG